MKREILEPMEFARRLGAEAPQAILDPSMPEGRIVCETASERDFGTTMRRTTIYLMHPLTFRRAQNSVWNNWGVNAPLLREPAFVSGGAGVVLPIPEPISAATITDDPPECYRIREWFIKP